MRHIVWLAVGLYLISVTAIYVGCSDEEEFIQAAPALLGPERVFLPNGMILELERGKLYEVITSYKDPNPPRPLTPAQQKRHIELCERLGEFFRGGNEAAHAEEIRRVVDELTKPEFKGLATGWTIYAYYWYPLVPDQSRPSDAEAILIDLRDRDEFAQGDTWRIVGRWK